MAGIKGWIVGLVALLAPICVSAQEVRPRSVLVLDQSDLRGPFYYQLWTGLRGALEARPDARVAKPMFNWQQMQHWNVSVSSLPEGSEIRFREPTFLEKYRWQSMAIVAALLIQAALIVFLFHERPLRRDADGESRNRMSELAHVNRNATAGELSSSIAHELNQPLGSILTSAETAELILKSDNPDLGEIREILADIKRDTSALAK
jgi:C4-dicarboxylate-specific signal transduction histidine kinase